MALIGATVFIARRDMVSKITAVQMNNHILVPKGYSNYTDPKKPSALITVDSVKATNDAISEALMLRDRAALAYKQVMKETEGEGRDQARTAYWEVSGGGLSKLWDVLCKQGHVICLVVRCPRCDSYEEMITMQSQS